MEDRDERRHTGPLILFWLIVKKVKVELGLLNKRVEVEAKYMVCGCDTL